MSQTPLEHWSDLNQRYLTVELDGLRQRLEGHRPGDHERAPARALIDDMPAPPAIVTLQQMFGLSGFERDLLLLCAGVELDVGFAGAVGAMHGPPAGGYPTFGMALATLPDPHWSALSPAGALRRWKLVEIMDGPALTGSPLRIDERVLHYLAGVNYLDEQLAGIVRIVEPAGELAPSHQRLAGTIVARLTAGTTPVPPVVHLIAPDPGSAAPIASQVAEMLGMQLASLSAGDIPVSARERMDLIRVCERESALGGLVYVVDCRDLESMPGATSVTSRFLESVASCVMVAATHRFSTPMRESIEVQVAPPEASERKRMWQRELRVREIDLNGQLDGVAEQFAFSPRQIQVVAAGLGMSAAASDGNDVACELWELCRDQARPRMDGLAQRIETAASWDDLVLPETQKKTLRDIAVHVRQRGWVYGDWGFARKSRRGLGISALFAGPSGTGKTMAAEVLANELRLDLYRIDLSQVVSKYIGETEKNLSRLFDAAEGGAVILLFDEADALFGMRSEVRDSHDRYANIEVSYLLQRMEAYSGLAILTTNLKSSIDQAFLRRIRFIVQFPFPDSEARASIWNSVFPDETPVDGLDIEKLSRLNVSGGSIRNIALNAAFRAAEEREPVRMQHLLQAARAEASKLERPLSDAEIRGWV